jgi:hypothetical protein
MSEGLTVISALASAVIGLAIISVIVSKNANTASVISSAATGFGNIIHAAVQPVSGSGTGGNLANSTGIYLTNPTGIQLGTV